eukprot:gene14684-16208_t
MYCKELASEAGISAKAMTTRPEADQGWQEVFGVRLSWRETKKKARRAAGTGGGARGAGRTGAGARGAGGAREGVEGEVAQVSHVGFVARRAAGVFPVPGRDREAEGGGKTEGMKFGIQKCGVISMKRGKMVKCIGIKLPDGEEMKSVNEEGDKGCEGDKCGDEVNVYFVGGVGEMGSSYGLFGPEENIWAEVVKNKVLKFTMCDEEGKRLEHVKSVKVVYVKERRRKKYRGKAGGNDEQKGKEGRGQNYTFNNFYQK